MASLIKHKPSMEALFASYGNLARRLLPTAARNTLYGPQHGCGFALDDFGTGVNSLSYLQCLSVTCWRP